MTRTKPSTLVLLAVLGGAAGWLFELALVAMGQPQLVPPVTFSVALALIGVVIVLLAVPVRQVAKGERPRIDPYYATRVVVLAKASSLAGALVLGAAVAILIFLLTRSVVTIGSVAMAVATVVGAVLLVVAGLVAEQMCTIPPDDDSDPEQEPPGAVRS